MRIFGAAENLKHNEKINEKYLGMQITNLVNMRESHGKMACTVQIFHGTIIPWTLYKTCSVPYARAMILYFGNGGISAA